MLVALVHTRWSPEKKETIAKGLEGLRKTCPEQPGSIAGIASLGKTENLWLYSHGSDTTFCRMTVTQLAAWLVRKGMPPGKRVITLKGCRTKSYAAQLQELLNRKNEYKGVTVEGFAGRASYTSQDGTMSIKVDLTEAEKRKIALAELTAHRDLSTQGVAKPEREQQVAKISADVKKSLSRKEAVRDTGLGSYEPLDERQARRQRRAEARTGSGTDTDPQPPTTTTRRRPKRIIIDSDEESESSTDMEVDSTQTAPATVPQQSTDTMDMT